MFLVKLALVALVVVFLLQFLMHVGSTLVTVLPVVLGIWILMIIQNRRTDEDDESEDY